MTRNRVSTASRADRKPLNFDAVLRAEQKVTGRGPGKSLGLALSGGGIRSATFNLGVIQALAELKLLRRFDYLSTVSGGGYIGGWLSLFIKRFGEGNVRTAERKLAERNSTGLEHRAIRFLRTYSNYLTPRVGLSGDTLAAIATYLRNLFLNQAILILLFAALLLLPRVVAMGAYHLTEWTRLADMFRYVTFFILILPAFSVARSLFYLPLPGPTSKPWFMRSWALVMLVDLPVAAAAVFISCFFVISAHLGEGDNAYRWNWIFELTLVYIMLWGAGVMLAYWRDTLHTLKRAASPRLWLDTLGRLKSLTPRVSWSDLRAKVRKPATRAGWLVTFIAVASLAGAVGATILLGAANAVSALPESHRFWGALAFGPPVIILSFALMVVVHVGLVGRKFAERHRELWSVFGARLLSLAIGWALFFGIAFYAAAVLSWMNDWIAGVGSAAWIASTLFGIIAGKGTATGQPGSKHWIEFLTRIAPYVFVLGLLLVLSWGLHRSLSWAHGPDTEAAATHKSADIAPPFQLRIILPAEPDPRTFAVEAREIEKPTHWDDFLAIAQREYAPLKRWFEPIWILPAISIAALLIALVLSWRVNINLFSLHHFYRNRLTRCYLGATNRDRHPNPLTGFDEKDDVEMGELVGQKPFHIVCAAVNLNRGKQLAWQNRRAASFTFTPLHAGYQPATHRSTKDALWGGYRDAHAYGADADGTALPLGTAIAISGAAVSPNCGFHTSPAVAFLLTVFNVRLGHWCGDPAHSKAWERRDPRLGLRYWLAELAGTADQNYPFLSLSDGGHFENLGIYELVRRRCKVILASDAGADPRYVFDDLAEAMRKCYTDFGVEIQFLTSVDDIRQRSDDQPSIRHYAIARINYPDPDTKPGILIYWKASLTADLPPDISHYGRQHKDFPHETTADQFFDESQFESYRHLGYEVAMRSIRAMRKKNVLPKELR